METEYPETARISISYGVEWYPDPQRSPTKRVWEGMLAAEIRANYFADLSSRYYSNQRRATWLTLLFSSGAAALALSSVPTDLAWLRVGLAVIAAGLSAYSLAMNNQKFAVDSADLHSRWSRLASEYEAIWENVYSHDAPPRLSALDDRAVDLSKAALGLKYDAGAMLRWEEHVVKQHGLTLAHA